MSKPKSNVSTEWAQTGATNFGELQIGTFDRADLLSEAESADLRTRIESGQTILVDIDEQAGQTGTKPTT
jgi:hypothetical protein